MVLSLNGVDPGCIDPITGSTCRVKCSNILHDTLKGTMKVEYKKERYIAQVAKIQKFEKVLLLSKKKKLSLIVFGKKVFRREEQNCFLTSF